MRVQLATSDDLPRLSALYAAAFIDDPMIRWPLPPQVGMSEVTQLFAQLVGPYLPLGVVWQVDGNAGSAAWLDPATTEKFAELDHGMRASIEHLTDDGGARYALLWDWVEHHLPDEPCWFLDMIAVDASCRGSGIGRLLVEHGLERAAADGVPAFLETGRESNVALYERFGFSGVHRAIAPGDGPEIWFMRTSG